MLPQTSTIRSTSIDTGCISASRKTAIVPDLVVARATTREQRIRRSEGLPVPLVESVETGPFVHVEQLPGQGSRIDWMQLGHGLVLLHWVVYHRQVNLYQLVPLES